MPVLVFLVDTSASMNQRTYLGTTSLDIAKGAVETFMKVCRGGRFVWDYCLFTKSLIVLPIDYSSSKFRIFIVCWTIICVYLRVALFVNASNSSLFCLPLQLRSRDQTSRTDRYMLVSCDEPPGTIKVNFHRYLGMKRVISLTGIIWISYISL